MNRPPVTQEEKKLVGMLKKKKSSGPRTHVFYNKKKKDGSSAYLTGKYYSNKNKTEMTYRSSYELKFFSLLEEDPDVIAYQSEALAIPYQDSEGVSRLYIPDIMVTTSRGDIIVYEIKPKIMLANEDVRLKAKACVKYLKKLLKDQGLEFTYKFITEDQLFSSSKEYSEFVKLNTKRK